MFDRPSAVRLRFLNGPQRGRHVALRRSRCRIGRSRDNDVVLPDSDGSQSSAHHAEAVFDGGHWVIQDLKSTNGTWLNGTRVSRARVGPGDRLTFGDAECAVVRGDFAVTASAAALAVTLAAILVSAYALVERPMPTLERSAALVAQSVYLIAVDRPSGRTGLATAFVVRPGLLATNAHVAEAVQELRHADRSVRAVAVRSDSTEVLAIGDVYLNRRWRTGSIAHDAALLRVDGAGLGPPLALADAARLASLARGETVAAFGFPSVGTDPSLPRGRLSSDVLGDVRDGRYLAVGLSVAPGTSGSPIFLRSGVVIGLVAGGDFATGADGVRGPSGSSVNWGISAAALHELLRDVR
ncbi:MAG: FHA domain-containing protein [Thermoleophilaceae bacterium]|nr:FHA domain-containing protein [Thermoleophilaceae bacterium]